MEAVLIKDSSPVASSPRSAPGGHLPTLDALRGIAALSVCWFHYTNAQFVEQFGHYRASGKYGWLGVQVFFVISGFVIPFSMFSARYRIKSFFQFMLKRIARLDPPYLVSVALVVTTYWLSSLKPGHPPYRIPWSQVLAHLGYLNAFLGMPLLQMSYWSLAIEFQYYIFVGLCFPLLSWKSRLGPWLVLALCAGPALLVGRNEALLPHYLPLFALGILAFRHQCLEARTSDKFAALLGALALAVYVDGWLAASVAAAACLSILFLTLNYRLLNFFGKISYSLYLTHVFVGNVVFGFAVRWLPSVPLLKWALQFIALGIAISSACVFYRLVELPSKRLASRINYKVKYRPAPAGS